MSNVLNEQIKQQVIALGRLGWSLRRIQKTTGVRRETASCYLREAGVSVRAPGWNGSFRVPTRPAGTDPGPPSAKPAIAVTTDSGAELVAPVQDGDIHPNAVLTVVDALFEAKPAIVVTTDIGVAPDAKTPSASTCAVHRDAIELGLSRGRNAVAIWQDLVDTRGFTGGYQSVKRFVRKLAGGSPKEACAVIETAPGEDYGESGVMVRATLPVARAYCWAAYFAAPSFP